MMVLLFTCFQFFSVQHSFPPLFPLSLALVVCLVGALSTYLLWPCDTSRYSMKASQCSLCSGSHFTESLCWGEVSFIQVPFSSHLYIITFKIKIILIQLLLAPRFDDGFLFHFAGILEFFWSLFMCFSFYSALNHQFISLLELISSPEDAFENKCHLPSLFCMVEDLNSFHFSLL